MKFIPLLFWFYSFVCWLSALFLTYRAAPGSPDYIFHALQWEIWGSTCLIIGAILFATNHLESVLEKLIKQ